MVVDVRKIVLAVVLRAMDNGKIAHKLRRPDHIALYYCIIKRNRELCNFCSRCDAGLNKSNDMNYMHRIRFERFRGSSNFKDFLY